MAVRRTATLERLVGSAVLLLGMLVWLSGCGGGGAATAAPGGTGGSPTGAPAGWRTIQYCVEFSLTDCSGRAVAVDRSGNVIVAGSTDGEVAAPYEGDTDVLVVKFSPLGAALWARQLGADPELPTDFPRIESATGVGVDSRGNVYVAGQTTGNLDGHANAGLGFEDLFLVKYDAAGTKLWSRQIGTPGHDYVRGMAVDAIGNVYVVGATEGAFDGNTFGGFFDVFLVKYDASGNKLWSRQFGGTDMEEGYAVALDPVTGVVYVVGYANVTTTPPGGGSIIHQDALLLEYNAAGTLLGGPWTYGDTSMQVATGVSADGSGGVLVAGFAYGAINGLASAGLDDAFLMKVDGATGTALWTRLVGTTTHDSAAAVAVDAGGNAYLLGETSGAVDGQTSLGGTEDFFLTKFDGAGTKQWTRQYGTSGLVDSFSGVATDAAGYVYVAGYTSDDIDYSTSIFSSRIVVVKYDGAGVKQ